MNPLLKKEIRLILPAWGLTLVLAAVAMLRFNMYDETNEVIDGFAPVWLGVMILCASSFGREFNLGTFSSLLAQPCPRQRYWTTKVGVLLAALLSAVAVYGLGTYHSIFKVMGWPEAAWLIVLLLAAVAGGLWLALLVRQMMAVVWLVVFAPAILCVPFLLVLSHFAAADKTVAATLYVLLSIYSVAGIGGSWLLFQRAQDAPWTGGTINLNLPEWMSKAVLANAGLDKRQRKPWRALILKEFHFNQVLLSGMAGLFILDLGEVVIRFMRRHVLGTGDVNQILQILGIVLWALVPLVIGCTSIAEERKMGILEGQLCQPVSARRQFIIKLSFTILVGGLLSSLFPIVTEVLAWSVGLKVNEPPTEAIAFMAAGMCAIALTSFLASSLTRNVLQALPLAVGMMVGIVALVVCFNALGGYSRYSPADFTLWSPELPGIILALLLPLAAIWLSWRNFQSLHEVARIWRRGGLTLAAVLLLTTASSLAIYHRAWEKLTPFEPAHGPAQLSLNQPPTTSRSDFGDGFLVSLPDGRNWFGCLTDERLPKIQNEMLRELLPSLYVPELKAQFISGSNWVSLAAAYLNLWEESDVRTISSPPVLKHVINGRQTVGIRADGTLWVSEQQMGSNWNTSPLVPVGNETDWRQVMGARSLASVLLLKKDGTLWRWGSQVGFGGGASQNWPDLRAQPPRQIGTNSDWQNLVQLELPMAQKQDGSLWTLNYNYRAKFQSDDLVQNTNISAGMAMGFGKAAVNPEKMAGGYGSFNAGIRPDGTLWIWGEYLYNDRARQGKMAVLQSSRETNWVAVAVGLNTMIALKSDGTLWQWGNQPGLSPYATKFTAPPRRLGIHNDWVAVVQTWWGITTLAADGSLWLWPNQAYYSDSGIMLSRPSEKPALLGNIFAAK